MMLWVLSFEFGYSHEAHHGFPRFGIRAETRALVFIHVSKIGPGVLCFIAVSTICCSSLMQGGKANTLLAHHWLIVVLPTICYAAVLHRDFETNGPHAFVGRSITIRQRNFHHPSIDSHISPPPMARQPRSAAGGTLQIRASEGPAQGLAAISAPRSYQRASLPRAGSSCPQIFGLAARPAC